MNTPAMSTIAHQSTYDFSQQAELLRGWNQDYAQVSSGAFEGYVSEVRFDDVHLFLEYSSQRLFQSGQLADDVIAIGVPQSFSSQGVFCGSPCEHNAMHVFSGRQGFEFFSPSQLLMGGMTMHRQNVLAHLHEDEQVILDARCHTAQLLQIPQHKAESVRHFMAGAFEMLSRHPQLLEQSNTRTTLNKTMVSLIADCLIAQDAQSESHPSMLKCWHIINATRDMVKQHADTPLSVADVCKNLNISRRTLQYCFQNLLDTTPIAYLRAERLNGVRRMLPQTNSVTEAAAHWGFWHFGHFSQEYKKMFGELPSVTFKRIRHVH